MTQKEIDVIFNITILIHEDKSFTRKSIFGRSKRADRELVQAWVAKMLAETLEIYTVPSGMSWGVLTSKERYEEYYFPH